MGSEKGPSPGALAAESLMERQAGVIGDSQVGHGRLAGNVEVQAVGIGHLSQTVKELAAFGSQNGRSVDPFQFLQTWMRFYLQ